MLLLLWGKVNIPIIAQQEAEVLYKNDTCPHAGAQVRV